MSDTPETEIAKLTRAARTREWRGRDTLKGKLEAARDESNVKSAGAELLAVQVLRIERERDEWKSEAKRWRDMYMQFDEMLESDIKDATEKVSDIIAQVEKLSKEMDKGY